MTADEARHPPPYQTVCWPSRWRRTRNRNRRRCGGGCSSCKATLVGGHDVVAADHALGLDTQNRVEVDGAPGRGLIWPSAETGMSCRAPAGRIGPRPRARPSPIGGSTAPRSSTDGPLRARRARRLAAPAVPGAAGSRAPSVPTRRPGRHGGHRHRALQRPAPARPRGRRCACRRSMPASWSTSSACAWAISPTGSTRPGRGRPRATDRHRFPRSTAVRRDSRQARARTGHGPLHQRRGECAVLQAARPNDIMPTSLFR
jgi:hypothetical protein